MSAHDELIELASEAQRKKVAALKRAHRCRWDCHYDSRHEVSAARWDGMAKAYRKAAKMIGPVK